MSDDVTKLDDFKNRLKNIEFAWDWEPETFYPITEDEIFRIFELLRYREGHFIVVRGRNFIPEEEQTIQIGEYYE